MTILTYLGRNKLLTDRNLYTWIKRLGIKNDETYSAGDNMHFYQHEKVVREDYKMFTGNVTDIDQLKIMNGWKDQLKKEI